MIGQSAINFISRNVYGKQTIVGEKGEIQHKGIGKKLLNKAEEVAIKEKMNKILIISGVGVRKYYEKQGYKLEKTYMSKRI